MLDLLGGRIDIGMVSTALVMPHVKAGRLKAIALVGPQRLADLPDVATMAEQAVGDIEFRTLLPLYGHPEMPEAIVMQLNAAMTAALADPATRKRLDEAYIYPMPMTPAEAGDVMRAEHERLGKIVQRLGIKADGMPG